MTYGTRYLEVSRFISYCRDLNVQTNERELEHYEKEGIMFPMARVVKPGDYVRHNYVLNRLPSNTISLAKWPEMERLYEYLRDSSISDEELIDSFDREFGNNPYLFRPEHDGHSPWNSHKVIVTQLNGQDVYDSTVEHYYSYWQVHQLYLIQQSPDLYENFYLLDSLCDTCKAKQWFRPWVMEKEQYKTFEGLAPCFDALSFYITMHTRERKRTFASIPVRHAVKTLDDTQHQAYRKRLNDHAQFVFKKYALTEEQLFVFLHSLIEKLMDYRDAERMKLADALNQDIMHHASLVWGVTGKEWENIANELGKTNYFIKRAFRHLDGYTKVRDNAYESLSYFYKQHESTMYVLGIRESDIDEILQFCEKNGLSILLHTLDESMATIDEERKFLRVTRYVNFKNFATALEYFLKAVAQKAVLKGRPDLANIEGEPLFPIITKVMKNETTWISILTSGMYSTKAGPSHFSTNLSSIQSERNDVARHFLLSCLARNLTVHSYPTDDWFYGDLFGELLSSILIALFYTWHVAKRENWI